MPPHRIYASDSRSSLRLESDHTVTLGPGHSSETHWDRQADGQTDTGPFYDAYRVVSVLDSSAVGPGFKSQPPRCQKIVLGKLFTPIVPLFTKRRNW